MLLEEGYKIRIHNVGYNCLLWHDCWLHDVPLKVYYEELYRMASHPDCALGDCWIDQDWVVEFVEHFRVKNSKDGLFYMMNFNTFL